MKYIYEEITTESFTGTNTVLKRTDEEGKIVWIPIDPANSDYQRYLAWLEDPNAENTPPIL
jgi:hypothetical protein